MTDSTRLDPSVHRATLFRAALVLLLWVATMRLRHHGAAVRLGLELVLTAAGLWAIWPGRRRGGPLFGEHGHWSSLVVALPVGFAIAAAAELWHLIRT